MEELRCPHALYNNLVGEGELKHGQQGRCTPTLVINYMNRPYDGPLLIHSNPAPFD